MNFSNITIEIKQELIDVVGDNYCLTEKNSLEDYCHDETEDLNFPPEVVVKPANTNEVSEIMKLASEYNIPVTPLRCQNRIERRCFMCLWWNSAFNGTF